MGLVGTAQWWLEAVIEAYGLPIDVEIMSESGVG